MPHQDPSVPERLIEVAGEIFAAKGHTATVREICSAANCSIAAVNYYFGDKQKLYQRCVLSACERKQHLFPFPKFEPPLAPAQAVELLADALRTIMKRMDSDRELPWQTTLLLREAIAPVDSSSGELRRYLSSDFERLMQLLIAATEDQGEAGRSFVNSLAAQLLARSVFFRTGKHLRAVLGLNSGVNESPEAYASDIFHSIVDQINYFRLQRGLERLRVASHLFPPLGSSGLSAGSDGQCIENRIGDA